MSSEISDQERVSRKKFLQTIAAAGAVGAAGLALSSSVISPVQAALADVDTASYIIDNESGTINAYNGSTGKVPPGFSGTDAATVVQKAINALPTSGGLIFVRAGTYPFGSAVTIPSAVALQGEGVDRTIITSSNGFFGNTSASQVSNIAIRDMTLQMIGNNLASKYFFIVSYSANSLRFERLKMLGGAVNGTGVFAFYGVGGPIGSYSDIQFIDVWADSQGTTSGNEFFSLANYSLSNIKFERCYVKNTSGPTIGLFNVPSTVNTKIGNSTLDSGVAYMNCGTTNLPITNRLEFNKCHFTNGARIATNSGNFQWEEFYLSDCTADGPLGVFGGTAYLVYLSDCWGYGTNPSVPGLLDNKGNVIIRGGGLVDGWNTAGVPWYSGGSALSLPTGNSMVVDIDGFYVGKPASPAGPPGGFLFNYSPTPDASLKITNSILDSSLLNVLNGQPGGPATYGGLSSFVNLINTGLMPPNVILSELTDLSGNRYFRAKGIASVPVTASPFTYPNSDNVPEAIYIVGGTVSQVAKDSTNLFTTSNVTVWLEPGESVTVTYSNPPSMFKDRK